MAAYAAVISLKNTIKGLLNSCSSSREILEFAYDEASSLQQVLEGLNNSSRSRSRMERVDAMEGPIRDCANKLEDFLETMNEEVQEDNITSFGETVKKMAKEYTEELSREDDDDDNDDDYFVSSAMSDFGSVEMVGHSEEVTDIRKRLLRKTRPVDMCLYSFCEYRLRRCKANVRLLGPTKLKQVLISIVAQIVDEVDEDGDDLLNTTSMLELSNYLRKALENRRYMIVLGGFLENDVVPG